MGLLGSLSDLVDDALRIVSAPVDVAVDLTSAVVKPLAEGAQAVVDEVKDLTE